MATQNSTINSEFDYVCANLADAVMLISSASRLIESKDGDAFCLLDMAMAELIAAQDYLEAMPTLEAPISKELAEMLSRIGPRQSAVCKRCGSTT